MINDLESNIMRTDNTECTSDKFPLKRIYFPGLQDNTNILCMSSSKKFIFLITDRAELLAIESKTLNPVRQAFSILSDQGTPSGSTIHFKENLTKIWTDRAGNHSIIRFSGKVYYFNSSYTNVKELNNFKGKEITAIGFDDNNNSPSHTGLFLAADYNNNIYECNIIIEKKGNNDFIIKDNIEKITTINFRDWDTEDEDEIYEPRNVKNERVYGIKFYKSAKNKKEIKPNEDIFYIMAVTKTRIYEFKGPGENTFKQTFAKYNNNSLLFNDSCKYFPPSNNARKKMFTGTDLDVIYRNDRIEQFGWKTDSGFCFGYFNFYGYLPEEIKKFTVVPFAKINNEGNKETDLDPLAVTHSQNHTFILYNDCLTIISKLTSNIIHTQYFQSEYKGLLYNEFYEDNGIILLYSKNGLYQISLKDENKDIWQDYLDIGDYANSQRCVKNNSKLIKKINRINADEDFEKKDYLNSAIKYIDSDEKFEIICLKYLMKNQIDALKYYLELYLTKNVEIREKYNAECNMITSMLIEIFLNKTKSEKKKTLEEFRQIIREKSKFLVEGNIIPYLLLSYGKMEEFVEYSSLMSDYEGAILYYINNRQFDLALEKLTEFSSFTDDKKTLEELEKIFLNNCHAFFKNNPKDSIILLKQRFKNINMESIVQSIISITDKDIDTDIPNNTNKKQFDNSQAILSYLKSLVEKPKAGEENNIHNLYIYYLSKNKANQETIIDYLKRPLKLEEDQFNFNPKKKEVLFKLDYAKKLFKDNPPAYSLVLALMGKYSEGVKTALSVKTPECQRIAKFIASNAPDEKLRKQLWIDIFSCDSQNEFQEALKIMKESKILKIEDVLPHITDTIKIEEFKKQISSCINDYEVNIKKLKTDIDEYNKTAENIKNDIIKIKKKSMEIQYSNCKCEICQGYIKEKNIFLFPCGHMFDAKCIRHCLLDYEATGLESIHEKNLKIDKLFYEIGIEKERYFSNPPNENQNVAKEVEEKKQEEQTFGIGNTIFNKFKFNIDIPQVFKKQEVVEDKNVKDLKKLKAELNAILSEQCVLCGDYMVDSIQCSICRPDIIKPHSDGSKLRLKSRSSWEYIQ